MQRRSFFSWTWKCFALVWLGGVFPIFWASQKAPPGMQDDWGWAALASEEKPGRRRYGDFIEVINIQDQTEQAWELLADQARRTLQALIMEGKTRPGCTWKFAWMAVEEPKKRVA